MAERSEHFTHLLADWSAGNPRALEELTPLVYAELRQLAQAYLRRERPGHSLQPTALVHEAYLRLIDQRVPDVRNRSHFFAIAAQLMRQILVDHARNRHAAKRAGGQRVSLGEEIGKEEARSIDLLALDEALSELEQVDARKARIVELRFFTGLAIEETAQTLNLSVATIHRELKMAETWLYRRLGENPAS